MSSRNTNLGTISPVEFVSGPMADSWGWIIKTAAGELVGFIYDDGEVFQPQARRMASLTAKPDWKEVPEGKFHQDALNKAVKRGQVTLA